MTTTERLKPGETAPEVRLSLLSLNRLVRRVTQETYGSAEAVLWRRPEAELLVFTSRVRVRLSRGVVQVEVPVQCDQASATITIAFAVGDDERPAGVVAATESRPRGPGAVVDAWGEALIALGWQVLVKTLTAAAAECGVVDVEGLALVPAAVSTSGRDVGVLPMARHTFTKSLDDCLCPTGGKT